MDTFQQQQQQPQCHDAEFAQEAAHPADWPAGMALPFMSPLPEGSEMAPLPYLMPEISSLMTAMTVAMGQGPHSAPHALAQTFVPLVNLAVALQLKALNAGTMPHASPTEHAAAGNIEGRVGSGPMHIASNNVGAAIGGDPDFDFEGPGGSVGSRKRRAAVAAEGAPSRSGRHQRRRKASSKFSEFVTTDDFIE